jgi:thiol-disulfide isomerase/thioredoxin
MHGSAQVAPWFSFRGFLICLASMVTGAGLVSLASQFHPLGATTSKANLQDGVLLDFTATWCGPCQKMSPIVSRLEQQGYPIRKVDVDQERDLAERFGIKTIPTFVLVVGGREVMRQSGGETSEAQLRRMLLQIPEWQRELARRDAKSTETKTVANVEEGASSPSPFAVELGEASPPEKPKSKFALPLLGGLGRNSSAPKTEAPRVADEFAARGQSPDTDAKAPFAAAQLPAYHTRLRVKDQGGMNFGSGTVIDSRAGRTLILTCGHLFRDLKPGAIVEVDVFDGSKKPETLVGQIVDFDLTADVGLVAIPTRTALPTVKLASINGALRAGERVTSVGCSGGELPSRDGLQITALNKYDGPDNVECTGVPIRGRSGGGLFRGEELIGVCIAADPKEQRGLYCGLKPIYELVEKAGFPQLLPVGRPETAPTITPAAAIAAQEPAKLPTAVVPAAVTAQPIAAAFEPISTEPAIATAVPATSTLADALQQSPDAEVICIVRPKNSAAPSRVVIVHQASPKLLSYLLDAAEPVASRPATPERNADALIPTSGSTASSANREFPPRTSPVTTSVNDAPRRPQSPRPR